MTTIPTGTAILGILIFGFLFGIGMALGTSIGKDAYDGTKSLVVKATQPAPS